MGNRALSKVQLGREATPGTNVPATFIWRGPFAGIQDARELEKIEEDVGIAIPTVRNVTNKLMGEMAMEVTPLTPEQAPHIFEAGVEQVESGTMDGTTSSGYTYTYSFPGTTLNTISTYTIQSGDESQAEEMEFAFVKKITITAIRNETVKISAEWAGRQVTDASFTGSLTPDVISHIKANAGTIYIDDDDGSFGGTSIAAGNILEMTLEVTTGQMALFTVDSGNLYFNGIYFNKDEFEASMEIKWLNETAGVAERDNWRNGLTRLIRAEFVGDPYETPGDGMAFSGSKGFRVDMPGWYEEFSAVEMEDGKSIMTATFLGGYDTVGDNNMSFLIANELANLP